jgi:LacI family transcriptional regulator
MESAEAAGGDTKSVAGRRVKQVAIIVDASMAPRRMVLSGVAQYVQEHEPWAMYLTPGGVEKSLGRWLEQWNGDGVIVYANESDAAALARRRLPVVDLFGKLRSPNVPLVHANDHSVGAVGAEHLLERGFEHFGFWVYTHPDTEWSINRCQGFQGKLREHGYDCTVFGTPFPKPGSGGPDVWEKQQRDLIAWLTALPKPAGVMTSTDLAGQQLLEACLRAGIPVPEQIAVIGVDNDEPICRIAYPPLSSVILNDHQRGYEAAALLDRMMAGLPVPQETVWIEPAGIVTRASTDIMAIEDPAVSQALRYIRENAFEPLDVRMVARHALISRSVLERRFKKLLGRTVHDEITRLRVNRAIELITGTTLPLKAIASKAGFISPAYMSAVFQAKLGRSPGSYRKQTSAPVAD